MTQWTTTLDVDRDFDAGLAAPLNVAFGAEYRRETYGIGAGIPASYELGGAQSYPGFSPADAGSNEPPECGGLCRICPASSLDRLSLDAAGRFEHYSDFGSATVFKLAGRWDASPAFAIRGTLSDGFRAPTMAEEFYSSTTVTPTTAFVQMPPNSTGGKLLGLGNGLSAGEVDQFKPGARVPPFRETEHDPRSVSNLDQAAASSAAAIWWAHRVASSLRPISSLPSLRTAISSTRT